MKLSTLLLLVGLLGVGLLLEAQTISLERGSPPLSEGGIARTLAFAGGLNSPQFSQADLNNDGQQDLFVFDRVGNVPLAFLRRADGSFDFRPEVLRNFPEVEGWILLRDYNGDDIADIFAYQGDPVSSVQVFRGSYGPEGMLNFSPFPFGRQPNVIHIPVPGSPRPTQLYVSEIDIPDINDVDYDGDLDILTFNFAGGYLEYYQNQSVERGYGTDSLIYELVDNCWGGLYESGISTELNLATSPGECASNFGSEVGGRHAGSTVLTLDNDGDGDRDLLLGDLSFANLNLSTNGGSRTEAWMNAQDVTFPSYDTPVDLPIFPAPFYVDVDGDGVRDLVVGTNQDPNGIDHENVWYYQNRGSDADPRFRFFQEDFLVGQMLDVGTGCRPAVLDHNADGLMDLVVGNYSYFELFGVRNPRLQLYENVGTPTAPAFALVDDDFLSLNQFNSSTFHFAPTFGDLDGDGDWDALVGEQNGRLFYLENEAGPGNPVDFAEPVYNYMDIRIGLSSVPQIIDLNRDGLADILIGERTGNINYFQNVGSPGSPSFVTDENELPNLRRLGGIDMRIPGFSTAYSSPWVLDLGDRFELFVGNQWGAIAAYGDISTVPEAAFTELYANLPGIREGRQLHPVFHDFDADGFFELVVGNYRGGLSWFETNIQLDGTVDVATIEEQADLSVYPNPTHDLVRVAGPASGRWKLSLVDLSGRTLREVVVEHPQHELSVADLASGIYLLSIQQADQRWQRKLIVMPQ
jgi:hypothetical protein